MKKKRVFGELELAILNIAKNKERFTVRDALFLLGEKDKYTTIMTVMNRMAEKKILKRNKIGNQYEYFLNPKETSHPSLLEKIKQKLFQGKSSLMMSFLLESSQDITNQELEEMEKQIQELKKARKV